MAGAIVKNQVESKSICLFHARIFEVSSSRCKQHRNLLEFLLQRPLDVVVVRAYAHISDSNLLLQYLNSNQGIRQIRIAIKHDQTRLHSELVYL